MILEANEDNIQKAAKLIQSGEIVSFPTETVYGLGGNALNENAVKKIFELKQRPSNNPLIVHVSDFSEISTVAEIPSPGKARDRLFKLSSFWPGPLTIILKKDPSVSNLISANLDTIGIRIPNHPFALALIKSAKCPIVAPSANPSNSLSPTSAAHVHDAFGDKLKMVIDGGNCKYGLESTVVNILEDDVVIYRPGAITKEEIEKCLDEKVKVLDEANGGKNKPSPGLLEKHYSPKTKLLFSENCNFDDLEKYEKIGRIRFKTFNDDDVFQNYPFILDISLSDKGNFEEIARNLFAALHSADNHDLDLILIDSCKEEGLGAAIMNRLKRAIQ